MMKQSIYNTILDFDNGRSIIYNALSDAFVVTMTSHILNHNLLATTNPTLKSQLEQSGMIVEEDMNEVEEVRNLISEVDENTKQLHIHINPTLACNFRCWYCYENHNNPSHMDPKMIEAVIKLINQRLDEFKSESIELSFFGGEPLLQFSNVVRPMIDLVKEISTKRCIPLHVSFTTNGFLLNEEMFEYFVNLSVSFQITLDGHRENHDKVRRTKSAGSYDTIISHVKRLLLDHHSIILRINYTTESFDDIPQIIEELKDLPDISKHYLVIDLQQVWQDVAKSEQSTMRLKTEKMMDEIKALNFHCSAPLHCDSVHNSCYGDRKNHILVNYDGRLFFCTARDFTEDNSVGTLNPDGVIKWDIEAVKRWKSCKFNKAICHKCRIAPICGGSCRQKSIETNGREVCTRGYSESDIDDIVLKRFYQQVVRPHNMKKN